MPVVVYNPVASSRRDVVKATVKMEKRPSGIKVISQKGEDMPAQVVSWGNGMAEILFVAQVDPLSFSVYSIQPAAATSSKNLRVKSQTIENAIYRITLRCTWRHSFHFLIRRITVNWYKPVNRSG